MMLTLRKPKAGFFALFIFIGKKLHQLTMKTLLLFLFTTTSFAVYGQQFSFQMFFTDAIGNKDTITLGYDLAATDSIDTAFGEVNIIGIPRDTAFDVRISNEWKNRTGYSVVGTYHTKKQIIPYTCMNFSYNNIQTVDIYTKHWPVTVTWDKLLFNDSCKYGSVFTSINPGGWWDTGSPSDLYQQRMAFNDSATFTSNTSGFVHENYSYIQGSDTIPVFWQAIAPSWILYTSIDESASQQISIKAFPNPFSTRLTFTLADNEQTIVSLYNLFGQQVLQQAFTNSTTLSTEQLVSGIYFYELRNSKGVVKTGKVVRE